ncbi:MAG: hypothetical protein ACR2P4_01075 [Gammaproteobacteria bacterium]
MKKSHTAAFFLAFFFSTLGLFYTSTAWALILTAVSITGWVVVFASGFSDAAFGFVLILGFFLWLLSVILNLVFVSKHNKKETIAESRHRELVDAVSKRDNAD